MQTQAINLTDHRSVDMKSVKCVECNGESLLNDEGKCWFCRREKPLPRRSFWDLVKELFRGK